MVVDFGWEHEGTKSGVDTVKEVVVRFRFNIQKSFFSII